MNSMKERQRKTVKESIWGGGEDGTERGMDVSQQVHVRPKRKKKRDDASQNSPV